MVVTATEFKTNFGKYLEPSELLHQLKNKKHEKRNRKIDSF